MKPILCHVHLLPSFEQSYDYLCLIVFENGNMLKMPVSGGFVTLYPSPGKVMYLYPEVHDDAVSRTSECTYKSTFK